MASPSAPAGPTSPLSPSSPTLVASPLEMPASPSNIETNGGATLPQKAANSGSELDSPAPGNDSTPPISRTSSSSLSGRLRSASLRLAEAPIPTGAWSGIGQSVGKAPSLIDLRRGSISSVDHNATDQSTTRRRGSSLGQRSRPRENTTGASASANVNRHDALVEHQDEDEGITGKEDVRKNKDTERELEATANALATQASAGGEGTTAPAVLPTAPSAEKRKTATAKVRDASNRLSIVSNLPHRVQPVPNELGVYPNGYHFPPKKTWTQATVLGLKGLWHFTLTPIGFLIVVYGCNVIAWGGMLFLLLCNASPVMCRLGNGRSDCNDIDSPRRVWIEIDSQVLTGLFCVTAFGLAPWRFRDLWYWACWRIARRSSALRKLAGYKKGWFRLRGSDDLPDEFGPDSRDEDFDSIDHHLYPKPRKNIPNPPLTGARAPPSAYWKMDFVVWAMVWNTFFQCVLCGLMWGYNRFDRPSWGTGLFVALGCVVAGVGGIMEMVEGKRVKGVEGVPIDTANAMADIESAGKTSQNDNTEKVLDEKNWDGQPAVRSHSETDIKEPFPNLSDTADEGTTKPERN